MVEECLGESWSQLFWELDIGLDGKESQRLLGKDNRQSRFYEDSVPLQPGQEIRQSSRQERLRKASCQLLSPRPAQINTQSWGEE